MGDAKDGTGRPLRVSLWVEPSPFSYVSGYANRFQALLDYLAVADDKPEVEIVTTTNVGVASRPSHWLGFPIHYVPGFSPPLYPHLTLSFDYTLRAIRCVGRQRPDVLHVSSPSFLAFGAVLASRWYSIPLLLSYHTHLPVYARSYLPHLWGFPEWLLWQWIRIVHGCWADATVVTSPQLQEEFVQHGMTAVGVWRKGIDTERFHPDFRNDTLRQQMTKGHPDDFLLVYIGRLAAEKGLDVLKDIMEQTANTRIRLCLVGSGPYRAALETQLEPYADRVVFLGAQHGTTLSQAFASADVFVMPSQSETLGFVVLESMASGVPVVAARAGGLMDLIRDGDTGHLVDAPYHATAFVDKILQLRDDAPGRSAMAQRARVETERWSWSASMQDLYRHHYQRAIQNMGSRWERRLWNFLSGRQTTNRLDNNPSEL